MNTLTESTRLVCVPRNNARFIMCFSQTGVGNAKRIAELIVEVTYLDDLFFNGWRVTVLTKDGRNVRKNSEARKRRKCNAVATPLQKSKNGVSKCGKLAFFSKLGKKFPII